MPLKKLVSVAAMIGFTAAGIISLAAASPSRRVGAIEGTVTGPGGPEAGVWVIAETRDLPTKFARIVVTDDRGRYLVPDLPDGTYDVWVRGYGLVDSPKRRGTPGATLNLAAVMAEDARAAAHYYPAGYWYSLLRVPAASEFPGTGAQGNGLSPNLGTQAHLLRQIKSGNCTACHQLGTIGTRDVPADFLALGSHKAAWDRRIQSGQAGGGMSNSFNQLGRDRMLAMYADWTERIARGETPAAPPRPQGIERNVVITIWDWADPKSYLHDVVSTDRRNPTVNANGKVYGALEASADYLPVLDPVTHTASRVPLTVRDTNTPRSSAQMPAPSPYWGDEAIWTSRNNVHNPMIDERGRVWITSAVEPAETPAFCRAGSSHPSAQIYPMNRSFRHLQLYDPKTEKLTHIRTCFSTHHLMFAEDARNTLWTSGGGPVIGWLNVRQFDATGDEQASQGWTPLIVDFNGNGKRDAWTDGDAPDSTRDRRLSLGFGFYAVAPAPDGSVWGSVLGMPGGVIRLEPGSDPARTALVEYYEPPFNNPVAAAQGFSPRGMDIDRNGVAWVALASGHLASFDRRKCKGPLNGPSATGQHCAEGWTLYKEPLPQFQGVTDGGSVEASYYTWVDQFNILGLGANTPINTGNAAEGLLALDDGRWVVLRVPYPLGFYTKWLDGRIDDPNAGWKGRGLWATVSTRAPFHMEGGKGTTSKVLKFQLRPNPLAR